MYLNMEQEEVGAIDAPKETRITGVPETPAPAVGENCAAPGAIGDEDKENP